MVTTPFWRTAPFSLPAGVFEPPVRRRFVGKAPHIQPVLSRDHFDVLVRKPEVPGVTQQRDAPRCVCKLAEVLDQPVPLELKYRRRRTDRDQDARASALSACPEDRLEKGFRFLNALAAEQFRAENASVEGNPVPHRAPRRSQRRRIRSCHHTLAGPLHRPPSARALGNPTVYELPMRMVIPLTSPSGLFLVTQLSCAKRSKHTAGGRSHRELGGGGTG